ncbi:MAG TPA: 2Fe-2S iron-sulfur cluster binding domain-containing protein [Acidimicrobiales bacterium]|nr:2Fe-2S iron-sulfur cluster binding domain-containing protein [Acidimicrobiales bacterium]
MTDLLTDLADRLFTPHGANAYRRRLAPASRHASPGTADRVVEPGSAGAPSSVDIDLVAETRPGITFARSGGGAPAAGTLLESVEAAGLTPKNRCRRGVCATCTTALVRGSVCDTRTGELVEGPAPIRLCVSVAEGPVTLDL